MMGCDFASLAGIPLTPLRFAKVERFLATLGMPVVDASGQDVRPLRFSVRGRDAKRAGDALCQRSVRATLIKSQCIPLTPLRFAKGGE